MEPCRFFLLRFLPLLWSSFLWRVWFLLQQVFLLLRFRLQVLFLRFLFLSLLREFLLWFLPVLLLSAFLLVVPVLFLFSFILFCFVSGSKLFLSYALIFLDRHCLLLGFVLTFPPVLAITHVGTAFFSFPAFASLRFFAVGLFLVMFISSLLLFHVFGTVIGRVFF